MRISANNHIAITLFFGQKRDNNSIDEFFKDKIDNQRTIELLSLLEYLLYYLLFTSAKMDWICVQISVWQKSFPKLCCHCSCWHPLVLCYVLLYILKVVFMLF